MRVVITEDIISRALNESIDEFILEEGMINEKWGDAVKGVWNGLKKAGNWVKNAAAMYMDRETNGQWNNKYGIYANGSDKMTEMYYLTEWFKTHLEHINQIEYKNRRPSSYVSRNREYYIDPQTNRKIYKDNEIDYNDIGKYAEQNITPENFNDWVGRFIQNRLSLKLIDDYIIDCQRQLMQSPYAKTATNCLSTLAFMNSSYGQQYLKTKNSQLNYQRGQYHNQQQASQQQAQQNEEQKNNVRIFFQNLFKNSNVITKEKLQNTIDYWLYKYNIADEYKNPIKEYLSRVIKALNDGDVLYSRGEYLEFDKFIKSSFGKQFA